MVVYYVLIQSSQFKMKNTLKAIVFLILMHTGLASKAQQHSNFIFFEQNMSLFNPAYTGNEGSLAGLHYRLASSGIEDSPRVATFIYHAKNKSKAHWGISYLTDKVFVENQGIAALDYSYKLTVGVNTKFYLGIKAGAVYNNIYSGGIYRITQESNEVLNSSQDYMAPLIGAGVLLKNEKYFIGVSVPNILNSYKYKEQMGLATIVTDKPHLYIIAGFDLKLNNSISLSPSVLYRTISDSSNQLTAIAKVTLKDIISLGIGVTNYNIISSMLLVKINEIDLGLGYEIGRRNNVISFGNTTELMLRHRFGHKSTNLNNIKDKNQFEKTKEIKKVDFNIQEAVLFDSSPISFSTLKISTVKKELPKLKFFIIAGAFSDPKNATKRMAQLKRSGYEKASYLGRNKYGLHQVSFQGFTTERAAREFLTEVQMQYDKDAWLLIIKD